MGKRIGLAVLLLSLLGLGFWAAFPRTQPPEPDAKSLAQQAATLHHQKKYKEAIELYRASLKLKSDPGVRANFARALAAAGESAQSAEQYQLLLQADPKNGVLWHDYGILLESDIKDLQAAQEALFNATQYPPSTPEASYDLGRVLLRIGRYEEAAACFEAAVSAAPPGAPWLDAARDGQLKAYLFAKERPQTPEEKPLPK